MFADDSQPILLVTFSHTKGCNCIKITESQRTSQKSRSCIAGVWVDSPTHPKRTEQGAPMHISKALHDCRMQSCESVEESEEVSREQ